MAKCVQCQAYLKTVQAQARRIEQLMAPLHDVVSLGAEVAVLREQLARAAGELDALRNRRALDLAISKAEAADAKGRMAALELGREALE